MPSPPHTRAQPLSWLLCLVSIAASGAEAQQAELEQIARPFLASRCVDCHGGQEPEGELVLSELRSSADLRQDLELWDYVLERVELQEMPPRAAPQPTAEERAAFTAWLTAELGRARAELGVEVGRPILRRLNLREYERAIADLFELSVSARETFPEDGAGNGFDTVGDGLSLSELFVEASVTAAEEVARRAVVSDDSRSPRERLFEGAQLEGPDRGRLKALSSRGDIAVEVELARASRYRVRVSATAQQAGPELARMAIVVAEEQRQVFDIAAVLGESLESHELELELPAGRTRLAARFVNDYYQPEDPDPAQRDRNLYIESIALEGPLDPAPRTRFQVRLDERFGSSASPWRERALLAHLVRRIWRRPVRAGELARLMALPDEGMDSDERLRLQLTALLASPNFLFRVELLPEAPLDASSDEAPASSAPVRALSGPELATRLALFLWSTVPDEALDRAADAGELEEAQGRERVAREMLASPRSRAFCESFVRQWLHLGPLERAQPDPERFPSWSAQLAAAMERESVELFASVLREQRPASELLSADWSWMNEPLAAHYGIADVHGADFRRVSLASTPRRGLLGQAAILTVTSDPARTSPVKRGKWVLDVLLNAAPPAAPPSVPALDRSSELAGSESRRESWARHRQDPNCAVCHDVMDPLGFGLENYDAIGRWRERYEHFAVDASGVLPDQRRFEGPQELAAVLLEDGRFLRGLVERILVYAVGRALEPTDHLLVDRILERIQPEGATLADIVLEVTRSPAFTHTGTRTRP